MGKLTKFLKVYEHPFSIRKKNGKGIVEVRFYEGYVSIYSRQPGSRGYEQEIHITRSTWYKLLNSNLRGVSRHMEGPDFDRYRAERRYLREEAQHLADQRELKRQIYGTRRRPRRRHRRV